MESTTVQVSRVTRERLLRLALVLGVERGRQMSVEETVGWLLDRSELVDESRVSS